MHISCGKALEYTGSHLASNTTGFGIVTVIIMWALFFGLIPTLWALAAAQSGNSISTKLIEQNSTTIDVLPKITPFQIPVDVLSGLGLPLEIPSAEQNAPRPGGRPNLGGGLGGLAGWNGAPAPPSFAGSGARGGARGGASWNPPPDSGTFGMQGGLPYQLC